MSADYGPPPFRVVHVDSRATVQTQSDGDLWPSAWADDGSLYAAAGDGTGFARHEWSDILVNRIDGTPESGLTGERLADGDAVSPIWGDPKLYNRKPTGMVAVDGNGDGRDELYLAVQDLRAGETPEVFNTAPAASVVRSDDYGRTWTPTGEPMFTGNVFTTIMFLDFGQSNSGAAVLGADAAGFVYAYGLDGNWRTSYSKSVPDPDSLYLARVPIARIQDREAWEFYSGVAQGNPQWTADIALKAPVLVDARRLYREPLATGPSDVTVLAQGGVVYNAPLKRYLYTSWSEYTFEFYEAPQPWGPWNHFLSRDFGTFPWTGPLSVDGSYGGYAPTIPSKFISDDGRDMWLQSNWFGFASTAGGRAYNFSLRRLHLDPGEDAEPQRIVGENLALSGIPLPTRYRAGRSRVLNDGDDGDAEDSWNGIANETDAWGYAWPTPRWFNRLVYTTGPQDSTGGWFSEGPTVEVRGPDGWTPVSAQRVEPPYPNDYTAMEYRRFVFDFDPIAGDAIRITGRPGGYSSFTSIAELEVYLLE